MVFYAMLVYLAYGVVLNQANLIWIQTADIADELGVMSVKPTGHVEPFTATFSLSDILTCLSNTIRVAKEIELVWAAHVVPPKEPWL